MYSYGSARSGKSMIRFFFKNHPKFSNQFVSRNGKLGVTLGRTDTFQNDNEFSSLSLQIFREIDDVWRFFREISKIVDVSGSARQMESENSIV